MKNLMKEAHKLTKQIIKKYGDVDYKTQLSLCLSFLASGEGEKEMLKESYKAIAVNSGLEMDLSVQPNQAGYLRVTKITIKGEEIFKRTEKNKYNAVLDMKINNGKDVFCLDLKNVTFKKFIKLANIKTSLKSGSVLIECEELKDLYIKLPKEFKRKKEEELKKEKLEKETQAAKYIEENKNNLLIKFEGTRNDLHNRTEEVLYSTGIKDMLKVISKSSVDLTKYRYDYFMDDYSIKEYFKCSYSELVEIYNLSIKNIEQKEKAEQERLRQIEENKQKHYNEVLKKAQETGEKQVLKTRTEEVQREESDIDVIVTYLYPDGHEETRRNPAY